ncbi:MAG: hypothetical protein ABR570_18050 [Burkholderiales bacterium]
MTVRRVAYSTYRRNMLFWRRRQKLGDEIRVTRFGQVMAILCATRRRINPT